MKTVPEASDADVADPPAQIDLGGIREKVCSVVDAAREGKPQYAIALALAIAADRVGEKEVAAVLAVKHDLDRFGFKMT